jgi:hypothetical protein
MITLERPEVEDLATITIDVVDGNGIEVAGEPLTVTFVTESGSRRIVEATTDGGGRVHLEPVSRPRLVQIVAGGETTSAMTGVGRTRIVVET